jgi:hypothetical protein
MKWLAIAGCTVLAGFAFYIAAEFLLDLALELFGP